MSGTSLDGIDVVLGDVGAAGPVVKGSLHLPLASDLRAELLALNQQGNDELRRAALAANELTRSYAAGVRALLADCEVHADAITAIGCHGQTVRHEPAAGYTIQLMNGALLAELTGIDVVCDFRSRDVAAGGQGAPLVPAFHHAIFSGGAVHRVIVNIGGISNVTDLPSSGPVTGFDCGPGNVLLDAWAQRHTGQPFDRDGAWGKSGRVLPELLQRLLAAEYFQRLPPKSAGRQTFGMDWLSCALIGREEAADVQATLMELTARTIADAACRLSPQTGEVYLCGGGARNVALSDALACAVAPRKLATTDVLGVSAEHVEALAFAWLAGEACAGRSANLPAVTGAHGPRILGALYRA